MERLPPIPTPLARRWLSFKVRVVPFLVFGVALGVTTVLWRDFVGSSTLMGEVEPYRAQVTAPQSGLLYSLEVSRFQQVAKGDVVAVVQPADPRLQFDAIQAQLSFLRAGMDPALALQRTAVDYERLRLDWLLQKVQLASDRVTLELAENELKRSEQLSRAKLISDSEYDLNLKNRDALQAEVSEKEGLIGLLEQTLERLRPAGFALGETSSTNTLQATIDQLETRLQALEASTRNIQLTAPIHGVIQEVRRWPGENVIAGEVIATIVSPASERIVGYLRQPFPVEPRVGMAVQVRTHGLRREAAMAELIKIGNQFEPITNSLALPRADAMPDIGLPIAVSIPTGLALRPGERVDLFLLPLGGTP
jgi:multidrug resistance efflux pump